MAANPYLPDELGGPSTAQSEHCIDPWSFLDYKGTFGQQSRSTYMAPTWVGDHFRRLQAYRFYEDLSRNAARYWVSNLTYEEQTRRREYGDPFVIVEQFISSVLGDDASVIVPDALVENPQSAAKEYDQKLRDWLDKEVFDLKLVECERNAIKLGDGVYVLGWNEALQRPHLEVWDPGFYFPVYDPSLVEQFPRKVHIAYEYELQEVSSTKKIRFLRRITWELVPLVDATDAEATRLYPWNDEPSPITCIYSDGTWRLEGENNRRTLEDLSDGSAAWTTFEEDLEIDFIPVLHLTNNVAGSENYGTSVLCNVAQILDDVVSNDTDLQGASSTTGSPPIWLSGMSAPKNDAGMITTYGPGQVFEVGEGDAGMIDTSRSLDALIKYDEHLLSRLSVNGRIPEALLGRVKPNEVPSGIALTLSFTPHSGAVRHMRLSRKKKYPLLLKWVGRFWMRAGEISKIFHAELKFGSYLPADKQEIMTLVTQGLGATPPALSLETSVRMLMEAGFPIEDAIAEVKRIRSQDFDGADKMMSATSDVNATRAYLGLGPVQAPPLAPPPPLPGENTPPGA